MNTIKTDWINWCNKDKCPLCEKEGPGIACVYKKGHGRANGIMLEWGISYCTDCASTVECKKHWSKVWQEAWKESEQRAEDNWNKYGVYTNMGGSLSEVSYYFGYAKTEQGLVPYLSVYPKCSKYILERRLVNTVYELDRKLNYVQCKERILKVAAESEADQDFKDKVVAKANAWLDGVKEWKDKK